jgi:hypothetical protein
MDAPSALPVTTAHSKAVRKLSISSAKAPIASIESSAITSIGSIDREAQAR